MRQTIPLLLVLTFCAEKEPALVERPRKSSSPATQKPRLPDSQLTPKSELSAEEVEPIRISGGGLNVPPEVIHRVEPVFPRGQKLRSLILLEATISRTGDVTNVKVLKHPGDSYAEAAATALRQWKFRPGTSAGKPVETVMQLTVNIHLK